jgi:hypothetical protein
MEAGMQYVGNSYKKCTHCGSMRREDKLHSSGRCLDLKWCEKVKPSEET